MYTFGISMGNEDYVTWTLFNKLFSQSCSSVSHVEDGQKYSKCVFVSDWDKGLERSLWETSLENLVATCVHHIKQNISARYGTLAAELSFYW